MDKKQKRKLKAIVKKKHNGVLYDKSILNFLQSTSGPMASEDSDENHSETESEASFYSNKKMKKDYGTSLSRKNDTSKQESSQINMLEDNLIAICESVSSESSGTSQFKDNLNAILESVSPNLSGQSDILVRNCPLQESIRKWSVKHQISHAALNDLLETLRNTHNDLPKDARTLLHTPRVVNVNKFENGEYVYFGIENEIKIKLKSGLKSETPFISMQVNVDGIPLFHSSSMECYPILGRSDELIDSTPFAIAVFCGTSKPRPLEAFLYDFIKEVQHLNDFGLFYEGITYNFEIKLFTCDAPARAYLKNISGHTSKNGCEKCKQVATWNSNRIVYSFETEVELRVDSDFVPDNFNAHIKGNSSLHLIGTKFVTQFVLDPMHLVYLGVVRRLLLLYWVEGKHMPATKFSKKMLTDISEKLVSIRKHVCMEFPRKPRSLVEVKRWKATEYRFFCLYAGIVVLKKSLSEDKYSHFLLLHCAIFILSNKSLINKYSDVAKKCIKKFIEKGIQIYGDTFNVYNVHSLQHIFADVENYGCIENYSCFPFENYLGKIKKLLRSNSYPLQQIFKRLKEKQKQHDHVVMAWNDLVSHEAIYVFVDKGLCTNYSI